MSAWIEMFTQANLKQATRGATLPFIGCFHLLQPGKSEDSLNDACLFTSLGSDEGVFAQAHDIAQPLSELQCFVWRASPALSAIRRRQTPSLQKGQAGKASSVKPTANSDRGGGQFWEARRALLSHRYGFYRIMCPAGSRLLGSHPHRPNHRSTSDVQQEQVIPTRWRREERRQREPRKTKARKLPSS